MPEAYGFFMPYEVQSTHQSMSHFPVCSKKGQSEKRSFPFFYSEKVLVGFLSGI